MQPAPPPARRTHTPLVEDTRELGRYLAGLPQAQATGMPVGTAKCYAQRGRNGLRARLSA